MVMTQTSRRGARLHRVVVPHDGASIVAGSGGSVTLRALGDGGVRVEPDLGVSAMLLRVDAIDGRLLRVITPPHVLVAA